MNKDRSLFYPILETDIEKLPSNANDNLELEIRFYAHDWTGKNVPLSYGVFQRVLEHFSKRLKPIYSDTEDTNYYVGNATFRKIDQAEYQRSSPKKLSENPYMYMRKENFSRNVYNDFHMRVSISKENNIERDIFDRVVGKTKNKPNIRNKKRTIFHLFNSHLDLTIVSHPDGSKSYEIELEMTNTSKVDMKHGENLRLFARSAQDVWKVIHDTDHLYTYKEKLEMVKWINKRIDPHDQFGSNAKMNSVKRTYSDARNLKLRDMVEGGLCLNDTYYYNVTDKADGERVKIVFSPWGILISKSRSLNFLYPYKIGGKKLGAEKRDYNGYIFEAELVHYVDIADVDYGEKRVALVFDTISVPDDVKSVSLSGHNVRLDAFLTFLRVWKFDLAEKARLYNFALLCKDFYAFNTPQEFYRVMRKMYKLSQNRQYKTDGFIFTPVNTPYQVRTVELKDDVSVDGDDGDTLKKDEFYVPNDSIISDQVDLDERILTVYPDICKLKPQEELTIDFTYDPSDETLSSWDKENKSLVVFEGTDSYPFHGGKEEIDVHHELLQNLEAPTIIEFRWNHEMEKFVPTRLREDKPVPNGLSIALDVWYDIFHPIDVKTFLGYDDTLMLEYHKREAEKFLNGFNKKGGTVLQSGMDVLQLFEEDFENLEFVKYLLRDHKKKGKKEYDFAFIYLRNTTIEFKDLGKMVKPDGIILVMTPVLDNLQAILNMTQQEDIQLSDFGKLMRNSLQLFSKTGAQIGETEIEPQKLASILKAIKGGKKNFQPAIEKPLDEEKFMNPFEFLLSSSYDLIVAKKNPKQQQKKILGSPVKRAERMIHYKSEESEENDVEEGEYEESEENDVEEGEYEESEEPQGGEYEESDVEGGEYEKYEEPEGGEYEDEFEEVPWKESEDENEEYESEEKTEEEEFSFIQPSEKRTYMGETYEEEENDEYEEYEPKRSMRQTTLHERFGTSSTRSLSKRMPDFESDEYGFRPMIFEEDQVERLNASWWPQNMKEEFGTIVRIGTIGDGSCFIHALMKALLPAYSYFTSEKDGKQYYTTRHDKLELAERFRSGAGEFLYEYADAEGREEARKYIKRTVKQLKEEILRRHPNMMKKDLMKPKERLIANYLLLEHTMFWKYFSGLYEMYQAMDENDRREIFRRDYVPTIEGIETLLKGNGFLGAEIYDFLADQMNVDFITLRVKENDIEYFVSTIQKDRLRKIVIINGTGVHYELMGVWRTIFDEELEENVERVQTTFDRDDPLIQAILKRYIKFD